MTTVVRQVTATVTITVHAAGTSQTTITETNTGVLGWTDTIPHTTAERLSALVDETLSKASGHLGSMR
jgi:hypothetical protein